MYPLENFYDGSSTTTFTNTNNCSTRNKYRRNYQQQIQQQQLIQQHYQIQQHQLNQAQQGNAAQFVKLIDNQNNSSTMRSNTNNTNSNFFVSPALSATSNRRHLSGSFLERIKYRFETFSIFSIYITKMSY